MKKRILIDVPNFLRDGPCLVYLKILLQKDFEVKLVESDIDTGFTILKYRPHAVILGQVAEIHGATLAKYAKSIGAQVIVLKTEGGFFAPEDIPFLVSFNYTKDFNKAVDLELLWSEAFKKIFVEKSGLEADRAKVIGVPRFDIYFPPLNKTLDKKAFCLKHEIDASKKIVVYLTNTLFADAVVKHAKKSPEHIEGEELIEYLHTKQSEMRETTTKYFLKLAGENPNATFVFKIHPWEDDGYYKKLVKKHTSQNVVIIKDILLADAINASDVILHTNSTACTEAWLLQKPVLTLSLIEKYDKELYDFVKGTDIVRTYDEFKKQASEYLNGKKIPSKQLLERSQFIEKWYHDTNGHATERAAFEITNFLKTGPTRGKRHKPSLDEMRFMAYHDLKKPLKYFLYKNRMLRHAYLRLRWKRKKEELMDEQYQKPFSAKVKELELRIRNALESRA